MAACEKCGGVRKSPGPGLCQTCNKRKYRNWPAPRLAPEFYLCSYGHELTAEENYENRSPTGLLRCPYCAQARHRESYARKVRGTQYAPMGEVAAGEQRIRRGGLGRSEE